jgi:oligopeptide transport system ATP-binding protein
MNAANGNLIEVEGLSKHFPITRGMIFAREVGAVRAVDGVDFAIRRGETLGLVGESGCGKSTTGRMLIRLIEPTCGTIRFEGQTLQGLDAHRMRALRREMQIIFQDPFGSLNPRMAVQDIIAEPLVVHRWRTRAEQRRRVRELLEVVGLASYHAERFPHEFSGGQRQRIGIARALALSPKFIICDEPVSALDVSIQAQIINLMQDLQAELGLTYLFISHDLGVVKHISDRVAVMYLGKIVEIADKKRLYANPRHPYTQGLMASIPVPRPGRRRERMVVRGDVPSPSDPPPGCRFHTRCPHVMEVCRRLEPRLLRVEPGHAVACHLVNPPDESGRAHRESALRQRPAHRPAPPSSGEPRIT